MSGLPPGLVGPPDAQGCTRWLGAKTPNGYGAYKRKVAHRTAWEEKNGPIPEGLIACHKCDVRDCVNPDHLFIGTQSDNIRDMDQKGRRVNNPRRGEASGRARLSDNKVDELRRVYARGSETTRSIAKRFGISKSQAHTIITHQQRTRRANQ